MKHFVNRVVVIVILASLFFSGQNIPIQAAPATSVCGPISSNTTWAAAGNPYVICNTGMTVNSGVTLTIEAGVTVQFQTDAQMAINGNLTANGTAAQPVTFTGDTPATSWTRIQADPVAGSPAQLKLNYVIIENGGKINASSGQLEIGRAQLTMTNSVVRNSVNHGIISFPNAVLIDVSATSFSANAGSAMRLNQPVNGLALSGLTATGNGFNGISIIGTTYLHGEHHWPAPGIPYRIEGLLGNSAGDSLSIDPGAELQFTTTGSLTIQGEFKAIGLPSAPITFTTASQPKTPGTWYGMNLSGSALAPANAQLDYVTIEYGGQGISSGANIWVDFGFLVVNHSIIRSSLHDGVRINTSARGSVMNSQILSNTEYGFRNTVPARFLLATNNWWGDPNGPKADQPGCSPGNGSRVTNGVIFLPVQTAPNTPAAFPLSAAPMITLTPRRWFAPADNLSKIYFDILVQDGNGNPLSGKTVRLTTSTLGTATDGGVTDLNGRTLAYLVSAAAGDTEVSAALDSANSCVGALSPSARVTFTPPLNITDLFPDSPASYFDGNISVSPLPVTVGVPTTIQAKLTNPLSTPITVDVSFGFAQSGIGLAYGPIGDIIGQVIPANSSVSVSKIFLPPVTGHYCVQVSYTITAVGSAMAFAPLAGGGSGLKQYNLDARQAPMGTPNSKNILDKADKSWKSVEKMAPKSVNFQKGVLDQWWGWAKDTAKKVSQALGFDPPRQDFRLTTLPEWHRWPAVQASADISAARAAALNKGSSSLADVLAYGTAAAVALDRYGGASEAHDLTWAAEQANARLYYQQQMGTALLQYATDLNAFRQVLINEGETNVLITLTDVTDYQNRLSTQGFSAQEISNAKLIGLNDADIEALRQETIATNPNDLTGNILDMYASEAAISQELGNELLHPTTYSPGLSVSGAAGDANQAGAVGNTLAQINNTTLTVTVGNPLAQQATIDLKARRISLPADWMVSVSPSQVTLGPGAQTTITLTVLTGSLVPQGSIPRVAVEGYANGQLLGGVAYDIVVPAYVAFDGKAHLFIPSVSR